MVLFFCLSVISLGWYYLKHFNSGGLGEKDKRWGAGVYRRGVRPAHYVEMLISFKFAFKMNDLNCSVQHESTSMHNMQNMLKWAIQWHKSEIFSFNTYLCFLLSKERNSIVNIVSYPPTFLLGWERFPKKHCQWVND